MLVQREAELRDAQHGGQRLATYLVLNREDHLSNTDEQKDRPLMICQGGSFYVLTSMKLYFHPSRLNTTLCSWTAKHQGIRDMMTGEMSAQRIVQ